MYILKHKPYLSFSNYSNEIFLHFIASVLQKYINKVHILGDTRSYLHSDKNMTLYWQHMDRSQRLDILYPFVLNIRIYFWFLSICINRNWIKCERITIFAKITQRIHWQMISLGNRWPWKRPLTLCLFPDPLGMLNIEALSLDVGWNWANKGDTFNIRK